MGRLTTTLTAAAAAGLTALAVTVAAPAIGDDTTPDKGATKVEHQSGPTPQELQACLQSHGATGVPGDERDGRALKEWIVTHQDDGSARAALKACDVYFADKKPGEPGPGDKVECASPKAAAAAKARKARAAGRPAT